METDFKFGDTGELFDFETETLEYNDGPLAGFVRTRATGVRYAFECHVLIWHRLWHWVLVPAPEEREIADAFRDAKLRSHWLSIVEDRRAGGASQCHLVRIAEPSNCPPPFVGFGD